MSLGRTFIKGLWRENPILRLAIGLVPALGITHLALNGVYLGLATTIVLLAAVLVKILVSEFVSKDVGVFVDLASLTIFTTLLYRLTGNYQPELLSAGYLFAAGRGERICAAEAVGGPAAVGPIMDAGMGLATLLS